MALSSKSLRIAEQAAHQYLVLDDKDDVNTTVSSMIDDTQSILNEIDEKLSYDALFEYDIDLRARKIAVIDVIHDVLDNFNNTLKDVRKNKKTK